MRKRTKRIILIVVIILSIVVSIGIYCLVLDKTVKFTGKVVMINYETKTIRLMNMETGEELNIHDISQDLLNTIDTGCILNIYESDRIEIVGSCEIKI